MNKKKDARVYSIKDAREIITHFNSDEFILELVFEDNENARASIPVKPSYPVLDKIIQTTESGNNSIVSRIRIYRTSDPKHAVISMTKDLLHRCILGDPDYDPRAPRFNYSLGETETRSKRLNILMRPSIQKELYRRAQLLDQSMSSIIDDLVSNWIYQMQQTE